MSRFAILAEDLLRMRCTKGRIKFHLEDNPSLDAMVVHHYSTYYETAHAPGIFYIHTQCTVHSRSVVKQKDCKTNEILKILTQKRIPAQTKIMICELVLQLMVLPSMIQLLNEMIQTIDCRAATHEVVTSQ
uniref:Uncharacterized protein n=1 Tax=Strigamia maritima TaxID=126957 RepID=T1INF9_STRMM